MRLVVGLGNPGKRYQNTRHNVGFRVVDRVASELGTEITRRHFESLAAEVRDGDEKVVLLKPETFMNLSGQAVRAAMDWYKLTPADLLVVCDDLNLPAGKLRARAKGSPGGQKGLESIVAHLGTDDFARLRIGIGNPGQASDWARYVLEPIPVAEAERLERAIERGAEAALVWARKGLEVCMNRYNADPKEPKDPPGETT